MHWGASGDQSGPVQVAVTVSLWNQELVTIATPSSFAPHLGGQVVVVPSTPPGHLAHQVLPQGINLQIVCVRCRSRSRSASCVGVRARSPSCVGVGDLGRCPGWVGAGQHALRLRGAVPGHADLANPAHHLGLHTLALPAGHNHQAGAEVTQYWGRGTLAVRYNGNAAVTTSAPRLPGVDPVIVLGGHSLVWEEVARRGDGVPAPVAAVRGGAAFGPAVLAAARGGWARAGSSEHLPILNIKTFCEVLVVILYFSSYRGTPVLSLLTSNVTWSLFLSRDPGGSGPLNGPVVNNPIQ